MSDSLPGPPLPKRPKRLCHFDPSWIQKFPGIGTSSKGMYVIVLEIHISCKHNNTGNMYARCTDFSISGGGLNAVTTHVRGKHHREMATACSSRSVKTFFQPRVPQGVIEAEALWTQFVAKHNILSRPVTMPPNSLVACFRIPT